MKLSLWLGIPALYLGFCGVMGVLLKRAWHGPHRLLNQKLVIAHGLLLFIPASILILGYLEWSLAGRLLLIAAGLAATALSAIQPNWIPVIIWQRAFGYQYFAATMVLSALWGFSMMLSTQTLVPILVAIAASFAGVASWYTAPRST